MRSLSSMKNLHKLVLWNPFSLHFSVSNKILFQSSITK